MAKSISKQAAEIGDVKIIVRIDGKRTITEADENRLNIVAAIVSKAFLPLRLRDNIELDEEIEIK